jgi:glycosyltransferase involved in cell wall biosynthesis
MRIVIDLQGAQSFSSKGRGVGRYTFGIVRSFIKAASGRHDIYLVLNGAFESSVETVKQQFSDVISSEKIKCWQQYYTPVSGISGNICCRQISELIREWYINQFRPDLIWSTNLQEGWLDDAVTSVKKLDCGAIYCSSLLDVIPLLFPEKYLASDIKFWYKEKIDYVKQSDIVLTISEYSKTNICELLNIPSENIHITGISIDRNIFSSDKNGDDDLIRQFKIKPESYILYTGGADEHKNLLRLITAFSLLEKKIKDQYSLVFVGKEVKENKANFINHAEKKGLSEKKLLFTGFIDDILLAVLYRNCALFVFPSFSEGFGIPVLEAMSCGCPVIASNKSSIPEVVGSPDHLFDPFDENDIAVKMKDGLCNIEYRKKLIDNGLLRADHFSWDESAEFILNIFENKFSTWKVSNTAEEKGDLIDGVIKHIATLTGVNWIDLEPSARAIADSVIDFERKPVLYLDLSTLVHFDHATGIQRVVRAITEVLMSNPGFIPGYDVATIFSYAGHVNFYKADKKGDKYILPSESDLPNYEISLRDGDILLFLDLHPASAISKKEELLKLRNRGIKTYFLLYDLLPVYLPNYFVKELTLEFENWLKTVVLSDGALCISKDVSDNLDKWITTSKALKYSQFKNMFFHLGADVGNSMPSRGIPDSALELYDLCRGKHVFLMVGTVEPRKGHGFVLNAFEKLWRNNEDEILIIVGKTGWRNEATINRIRNHKELNKRLFWLEGISDEYLEKVYALSTCLIAASEGEGFGLPIIEAAMHGLPVIARDIPVFREVAGDCAYYFPDSNDSSILTDCIGSWIELFSKKNYPKSDNMRWLTWKDSAKMLIECLLKE